MDIIDGEVMQSAVKKDTDSTLNLSLLLQTDGVQLNYSDSVVNCVFRV